MKNSILAKMGFMMKSDKTDLDQQLAGLEQKILDNKKLIIDCKVQYEQQGASLIENLKKLECIAEGLRLSIERLDRKINIVSEKIADSHVETAEKILDSYSKVSKTLKGSVMNLTDEIGNNRTILDDYIKQEQNLLVDINQKIIQQNCDAISMKNTCEDIYKKSCDINTLIKKIYDNELTKEDIEVVESFLRLIAANQLMQEANYSIKQ